MATLVYVGPLPLAFRFITPSSDACAKYSAHSSKDAAVVQLWQKQKVVLSPTRTWVNDRVPRSRTFFELSFHAI